MAEPVQALEPGLGRIPPEHQRALDARSLEVKREELAADPGDVQLQRDVAFTEGSTPPADFVFDPKNVGEAPKFKFDPDAVGETAGFMATARSLLPRARLGLEQAVSGWRLFNAEPDLAKIRHLSFLHYNMSPEDLVAQAPDNWLAQDYVATKQRVAEERLTASGIQQELMRVRPAGEGLVGRIVGSTAESFAPTAAILATGLVTRSPLLTGLVAPAVGFTAQAGSSYLQATTPKAEGGAGADPVSAKRFATRTGLYEAALEYLPIGAAMRFGGSAWGRAGAYLATEAGTEFATQLAQGVDEKISINPQKSNGEILTEALEAGASGALMGAVLSPALRGFGPGAEQIKAATVAAINEFEVTGDAAALQAKTRELEQALAALAPPQEVEATGEAISPDRAVGLMRSIAAHKDTPANPENAEKLKGINVPYEMAETEVSRKAFEAAQEEGETPDIGRSAKAQETLRKYINDNDLTPTDQLPITYGPESEIGKSLQQATLSPATYGVGYPNEQIADSVFSGIIDTVENMRQRFMPEATLIIANQTVPRGHATAAHKELGPGVHLIIPRNLTGLGVNRDVARYNPQTLMTSYSALTHEVGHALLNELERAVFKGPDREALTKEYNDLKDAVLSGNLTSAEFIDRWLGPGKVALGLLPTQKLQTKEAQEQWKKLGKDYAKNRYRILEAYEDKQRGVSTPAVAKDAPALEFLQVWMQRMQYPGSYEQFLETVLSFPEYFAEQTARYEYYGKKYEGVGLGKLFKQVLDRLRAFFRAAKADGRIAPGTAFQEFLDNLTAMGGLRSAAAEPTPVAPKPSVGPPPKLVTPAMREAEIAEIAEEPKPQEIPDPTPGTAEYEVQKKTLLKNMISLQLPRGSQLKKDILDAIREGKFATAEELINEGYNGVNYDIGDFAADRPSQLFLGELGVEMAQHAGLSEAAAKDPKVRARAEAEWQSRGTRSTFFRRWFGDWTNETRQEVPVYDVSGKEMYKVQIPTGASHVMDLATGQPLIMYHGSRFTELQDNRFKADFRGRGAGTGAAHLGFFATSDRATAKWYANVDENLTAAQQMEFDTLSGELDMMKSLRDQLQEARRDLDLHLVSAKGTTEFNALRAERKDLTQRIDSIVDVEMGLLNQISRVLENSGTIDDKIYPLYASLRNPKHIDFQGHLFSEALYISLTNEAKDQGHDGMILRNVQDPDRPSTVIIAFRPDQLKSADKNATFSDTDDIHWDLMDGDQSNARKLYSKVKKGFSDKRLGKDLWYSLASLRFGVFQLQQLAHLHPEYASLQGFTQQVRHYTLRKLGLMSPGEKVMNAWQFRSFNRASAMERAIQAEVDGGVHWTDLVPTNIPHTFVHQFKADGSTFTELKKHGIDVTTRTGKEDAQLWLDQKNALLNQLQETEKIMSLRIIQRYGSQGQMANQNQQAEISALISRVDQYRNKPFFPLQRFGKFVWQISELQSLGPDVNGKDVKRWRPVHREAFESEAEWRERGPSLEAMRRAGQKLEPVILADKAVPIMQLPTDFAALAASELGLTPDQTQALMSIMQPVKQDKTFRAYEKEYRGITGYSPDMIRSFASYFWHNSNTLAKLEFKGRIQYDIRAMRTELREVQEGAVTPEQVKAYRLYENLYRYAEGVREYMMNPADEYYKIRSAVALIYLWGNFKTAVLNGYGLVTTWLDVTTSEGFLKGNGMFLKSVYDNFKILGGRGLSVEEKAAFKKATDEGVLEQSYAFYLAGQATAGSYARMFQRTALGKPVLIAKKAVISGGMFAFRAAEIGTRRVTWLVKYRQAKAAGLTDVQAYNSAAEATNILQNDYSLGARPPFLRGKKNLLFVFASFTQHMAFHAFGGYERGVRAKSLLERRTPRSWMFGYTMKLWLVTLLLAGLEGLPGMENILDVMDIIWRKFTGKTLRFQIRKAYFEATGKDAAPLMYGLGHEVGPFDISRSIGLGRIVPGTDAVSHTGNLREDTANMVFAVAGPLGGLIQYMLKTMYNNGKPWSSFERWTSSAPGGIGNILNAVQWSMQGARAKSGALLTRDLETQMIRDMTPVEIGGRLLGFQPTAVTEERERRFVIQEEVNYWTTRRKILLDQLWFARNNDDAQGEDDVRKSIEEFNSEVPHGQLRISGKSIRESLKRHQLQKREEEIGRPVQRKFRGLAEEVREVY